MGMSRELEAKTGWKLKRDCVWHPAQLDTQTCTVIIHIANEFDPRLVAHVNLHHDVYRSHANSGACSRDDKHVTGKNPGGG